MHDTLYIAHEIHDGRWWFLHCRSERSPLIWVLVRSEFCALVICCLVQRLTQHSRESKRSVMFFDAVIRLKPQTSPLHTQAETGVLQSFLASL